MQDDFHDFQKMQEKLQDFHDFHDFYDFRGVIMQEILQKSYPGKRERFLTRKSTENDSHWKNLENPGISSHGSGQNMPTGIIWGRCCPPADRFRVSWCVYIARRENAVQGR